LIVLPVPEQMRELGSDVPDLGQKRRSDLTLNAERPVAQVRFRTIQLVPANRLSDEVRSRRRHLNAGGKGIVPGSTYRRRVRKWIWLTEEQEVRNETAIAKVSSGSVNPNEGGEEDTS